MDAEQAHYCTGCGQMHGGEHRESDEVAIARINREADVRIAQLARGETKLAADADVEATEIQAEAMVDEAVVKNEVLEEMMTPPEPEPEPVVVVADETAAPAAEEIPAGEPPEAEPAPEASKSANPWWG